MKDYMSVDNKYLNSRDLYELVLNLADESGVQLTKRQLIDGRPLGCVDAYVLTLYAGRKISSVKIFFEEAEDKTERFDYEQTSNRIKIVLRRMKDRSVSLTD